MKYSKNPVSLWHKASARAEQKKKEEKESEKGKRKRRETKAGRDVADTAFCISQLHLVFFSSHNSSGRFLYYCFVVDLSFLSLSLCFSLSLPLILGHLADFREARLTGFPFSISTD